MSIKKMKAALLYGVKDLKLEYIDIPEIGENETQYQLKNNDLIVYKP
jgi:hypothetical protein